MQFKSLDKDKFLELVINTPWQKKLLVLGGIIVGIAVLFYFLLISPTLKDINKLKNQIKSLEATYNEKQSIANDLASFRREVERLNQELKDALTLLPNSAEIPELLSRLSEVLEKSGLRMEVFELGMETPAGFYARVPIKIEVSGSFHEILVFFDKVSKLPRIINISDITFKDPTFKNQKMILKAEFLATTFRFIEAQQQPQQGQAGAVPVITK
ncbi:MAG: type 4a pilus biogenesis protein PilO [Deltaproteobacteria bacterium]|nr:type 4a pilus biogenesis protein PilO [Deltaproteobacteria bacterium]